jgi:tetratricopeptide (TPR) repeat protein/DNA-binding SARP family transcriptional activator
MEVLAGGVGLEVGPASRRAVLAVLAAEAGRVVSMGQLVDRLWGGAPPRQAQGNVHSYVSRLRGVLGAEAIARRSGGYRLDVDPLRVDLHRFRHLVFRARRADEGEAAGLWDEALELWRGEAFEGLDVSWLHALGDQLAVERLGAELDRNETRLRRGEFTVVLPGLASRCREYPLDERFGGQYMLALHQAGRSKDALDHFARLRRRLIDELGNEPGGRLRELHKGILDDDAALRPPVSAAVAVPRQLPADPVRFTGRDAELALLDDLHRRAEPVWALNGQGGVGKTWLALRWGNDNAREFPDGQLYLNLRGFDPTEAPVPAGDALRQLLESLGAEPDAVGGGVDAQAATYRSLVSGRRILIVLDNARDSEQVAPLLPGGSTATTIVTSRNALAGLSVHHGAIRVGLDLLDASRARELLSARLGGERTAAEPDAIDTFIDHCGGLPLALSILAARAAAQPGLGELAADLRCRARDLDTLDAGEISASLRAVLDSSRKQLPPEAATCLALLSLAPGPDFAVNCVASLAGLPAEKSRLALTELEANSLIQQHAAGRYVIHDLTKQYARECLEAQGFDGDRSSATARLIDYYLHSALAADRCLMPTRDAISVAAPSPGVSSEAPSSPERASAWFARERQALQQVVRCALDEGRYASCWQIGWALTSDFLPQGRWIELAAALAVGLEAARRLGDRTAELRLRVNLAKTHVLTKDHERAQAQLHEALRVAESIGDKWAQGHLYLTLGQAADAREEYAEALPLARKALERFREIGRKSGQATALNLIGWLYSNLDRHREALAPCREAIELSRESESVGMEGMSWDSLGYAHQHLGDHDEAIRCFTRALEQFRASNDAFYAARALVKLGESYRRLADVDAARRCWGEALEIFSELGRPDADEVRAKLRGLGTA